jgi:integrase
MTARDAWDLPVGKINWKIHTRKEPRERVRFISPEEARRIHDELPPHIQLMFLWTLYTGCRLNETETLRWSRVNLDARTAEVDTKGGGTRFIQLSNEAMLVLSQCPRDRMYVFDTTNRRKLWEAALAKCQIADFRWHDIRHTHACWLGQRGVGLHVIQKSLGHSQITTTMRYLHAVSTDVQEANERLPTIVEGKVETLKRKAE